MSKSLLVIAKLASPLESKTDATMRSTTPSFLTLAGLLIHIGSLKVNVATSMGSSVPVGIVRLLHRDDSNSTTLKEVQSMKLSVL